MTKHLLNETQEPLTDVTLGSAGLMAKRAAAELDIENPEPRTLYTISESDSLNNDGTPSYGAVGHAVESDDSVLSPSQFILTIAALNLGTFLSALDGTIVTTLLASIASDLNSLSRMSWIATSYFLSCSAFQPLYGKLSDVFGRKSCLLFSNLVFAAGCLMCGLSTSLLQLSIARFIAGIGGGGLTSLSTMATSDIVPLRKRGVFQGIGNICFASGAAAGSIVGALFLKSGTSGWKWAFIFQAPLAAFSALLLAIVFKLPAGSPGLGVQGNRREKLAKIDFSGSFTLVTSILIFMTLVSCTGQDIAFGGLVFWTLVVLNIIAFSAFLYVELYVATQPVVPVRLLGIRTVAASSLTNFFCTMAVFTYLFYMPVYWQSVLGLPTVQVGLRTISNFIGVATCSLGSGIYMRHTGKYLGFSHIVNIVAIAGVFWLYWAPRTLSVPLQYLQLLVPGGAYAAMLTVTLLALIAAVPFDQQALVTSIQYAFRATGSTIGVAIASAIFQNTLSSTMVEKMFAVDSGYTDKQIWKVINKALESSEYIQHAPKVFRETLRDSYDEAVHWALLFAVFTIILAAICGSFMKEHTLHASIKRSEDDEA